MRTCQCKSTNAFGCAIVEYPHEYDLLTNCDKCGMKKLAFPKIQTAPQNANTDHTLMLIKSQISMNRKYGPEDDPRCLMCGYRPNKTEDSLIWTDIVTEVNSDGGSYCGSICTQCECDHFPLVKGRYQILMVSFLIIASSR